MEDNCKILVDKEIVNELLSALDHLCHNAAIIQLVSNNKGTLLEDSYNMVREFGEFLPNNIKPQKKVRQFQYPIQQEPQF